jgi:hypothetical protein
MMDAAFINCTACALGFFQQVLLAGIEVCQVNKMQRQKMREMDAICMKLAYTSTPMLATP